MSSVREDIAKIICPLAKYPEECEKCTNGCGCPDNWPDIAEQVDQILSLKYPNGQPKLGIISEDQSHECSMDIYADYTPEEAYREGIRDMLNSNFKRIEE